MRRLLDYDRFGRALKFEIKDIRAQQIGMDNLVEWNKIATVQCGLFDNLMGDNNWFFNFMNKTSLSLDSLNAVPLTFILIDYAVCDAYRWTA